MNGVIVQEAKIFDPRTLPAYIEEATRFRKAPVECRDEKGRLYFDTTSLGMSLYPHTVAYLKPLNVSDISNLRVSFDDEKLPGGITNLEGLSRDIAAIAHIWPEFDAVINPSVPVGKPSVRISMHYNGLDEIEILTRELEQIAEDYRQGKTTPKDESEEKTLKAIVKSVEMGRQQPSEYKQRSIRIAAKFDEPEAARIGLRQLITLFPEMLFEEELFAVKLPEDIAEKHRKASDYLHAHWCYEHDLGPKPDYEFNAVTYHRLTKDANMLHLLFSANILQGLGIAPRAAKHFSESKTISVPVSNYEDVAALIADDKYASPHIPTVSAAFGDRSVELDFNGGNATFGIFDLSVAIKNMAQAGTLEDILEKVQSNNVN